MLCLHDSGSHTASIGILLTSGKSQMERDGTKGFRKEPRHTLIFVFSLPHVTELTTSCISCIINVSSHHEQLYQSLHVNGLLVL